jgi:putative endonuclease
MSHNQNIGSFGEEIAADYLIAKGWKIIKRNIKISYQEIDILALKDGIFAFIEVKTRVSGRMGGADLAITGKKIKNIEKGILKFIYRNKINENCIRIDLISVDISTIEKKANIKHYTDII